MAFLRPHALTCQEVVELGTDYLEEALSAGDQKRLERHFADCPHCSRHLEQLRTTLSVLASLRDVG